MAFILRNEEIKKVVEFLFPCSLAVSRFLSFHLLNDSKEIISIKWHKLMCYKLFWYIPGCAYKLGICALCGKKILDTSNYKQSSV